MRMHLGAQHFRDDDSSRSARRLLFNRACCLILFLFLSSLVLLERARRACPPCFLKGARPRASHDRDTTPLHRTFGEANLEALRMRVTHVARGKRQTRGKVQGVLRAALPHTASEREPAIRRVFFARQAILSLPGGMRVHTRGLERPQLARHGLSQSGTYGE